MSVSVSVETSLSACMFIRVCKRVSCVYMRVYICYPIIIRVSSLCVDQKKWSCEDGVIRVVSYFFFPFFFFLNVCDQTSPIPYRRRIIIKYHYSILYIILYRK